MKFFWACQIRSNTFLEDIRSHCVSYIEQEKPATEMNVTFSPSLSLSLRSLNTVQILMGDDVKDVLKMNNGYFFNLLKRFMSGMSNFTLRGKELLTENTRNSSSVP